MKKIYHIMMFLLISVVLSGCTSLKRFEPENLFSGMRPLDYLTDANYKSLMIEVIAVEGETPYYSDLDAITFAAMSLCKKPNGVQYEVNTSIPADSIPAQRWSDSDINNFTKKYALMHTSKDVLVLHLVYLKGVYYQDYLTTGAVTVSADTIAFFPDVYRSSNASSKTIILHEFGHCIGACNNGTPAITNHEDPSSPGHCLNPNCIMYFQSTTQAIYCSKCLQDLKGK